MGVKSTEIIIDQILDLLRKKPIDGYEIYLDESTHFEVESKEGKVDTLEASQAWGMAIRILNRGGIGFSYTTSLLEGGSKGLKEGVEQTIEDAISSAEVTTPDPCFDFSPPLKNPLPTLPVFDETLRKISEKRKIEKAKLLEEAARAMGPEIKKVRKASYQDAISRTTLANSNGLYASYEVTLASVSVMAVAERSGESEVGWDFDFSHFIEDLDVEKVGKAAAQKALERLGGRRIPSGTYPVVFENQIASEFLSLLAHSFLSEQVQKGKSAIEGKKGERFFSPLLFITDDGLLPKGASTLPIDGEGTPTQRTPLVVKGEISGYLYDRFWAKRENTLTKEQMVRSTGNSRRPSIKSPPGLGTSNYFIEAGESSFPSLLRGLAKGLVVEEVMGLHTVDPISGDFSLGCSGYWVEKEERTYPVKSIAIAGNLFQLFKRLVAVGDDLRFFGKIGSPSLSIEGLEVSGN